MSHRFWNAKILFLTAIVAASFFLFTGVETKAETIPVGDPVNNAVLPRLSVPDFNVTFTAPLQKNGKLEVNFLGEYLTAVYQWLIKFSIFFVIVIVMIGGVQYIISSGSANVAKAKERITKALTGFVLLMGVYVILFTVNPKLTVFPPISLQIIDPVKFIEESGDEAGTPLPTTELGQKLAIMNISCAEGTPLPDIAAQFLGKVTYRFGGKGGEPPYNAEKKTDQTGKAYKEYCPPNTLCADCSGFVQILGQCAHLPAVAGGSTKTLFASAPKIKQCNGERIELESGSATIKPGDLVGFKPGDDARLEKFGHVWMYLGDGKIINSAASGRSPGKAIKIQTLGWACDTYPLRLISR